MMMVMMIMIMIIIIIMKKKNRKSWLKHIHCEPSSSKDDLH